MNFVIWLVVGGVLGWLASLVMKTDREQGLLLNIVVGIVGALLGGWLLSPLFGVGTINQNDFSIGGLLVSFLGALILLFIVNLIRGRGRPTAP
ncbi:MAG: transglycosylase [Betaproteobacteria bacterium RIFCSPLOWO2_02_FULL_65_24]|nr:MAG: transglycosylase [Betaproteobacteria bacterium RIFCSPLOWO2_02_FULL_65_24]OGA93820.1 MAG: transglycosylase [Betaproteobacteria bacterium RIFCSPLOWO2_12_FULL_66_14]